MVKLVVLYGQPDDPAAFDAYYADTHAPLAEKIPGLRKFEHGKVLGPEPPYYFMAALYYDDLEALEAGRASAEGQAAAADVANFATGGATLMVAEVS
jgi:uncharacterized protein (TIGR02118 family)